MNTTTKRTRRERLPDPLFPDSKEGNLMRQCERLANQGRLRFDGYGGIYLRRQYYKGRFGSRLFRAAVEILTRRQSCIISMRETRGGKPVDVVLRCPNCFRKRAFGRRDDPPRFCLEEWHPRFSSAIAVGSCSDCRAIVELHREADLTWRAKIDHKELSEESGDFYP